MRSLDAVRRWHRPLLVCAGFTAFAICLLHLGELGRFPWDTHVLLATGGLAGVLVIGVPGRGWRALAGLLALPLTFLLWQAGHASHASAFAACLDEGEIVRQRLDVFRRQYGAFPAALNELPGPLPCALRTRDSLLDYQRTADGYRLSFADSLVTHAASERLPFSAHK